MCDKEQDEYWVDCIVVAFLEEEINATLEQVKAVAQTVQEAYEVYGEAKLRKKVCPECEGDGYIFLAPLKYDCETCDCQGHIYVERKE